MVADEREPERKLVADVAFRNSRGGSSEGWWLRGVGMLMLLLKLIVSAGETMVLGSVGCKLTRHPYQMDDCKLFSSLYVI